MPEPSAAPYSFTVSASDVPEVRTFTSVHHPGDASATAVWGRAFASKLAVVMLAVFIVVAGRALMNLPIATTLVWGAGLGLVAAWYVTRLQLERRIVEVRVAGHLAGTRTALDAVARRPVSFSPVLDVRRGEPVTTLTLGDDVWELEDADWPELAPLLAALGAARKAAR